MKLLQINSVVNSGSTGRIAEEIGITAMQAGWISYIAFGRNNRPSKSNKIKIGTELDVKWHGVITRLFDRHAMASCGATKKLVKKIEEIQPDIIHLHNIHGYYLNIKILFDYLAKIDIPVVWTLHDCWTFTGHCSHFSFVGCDKWKTQCNKCQHKIEYPASYGLNNSYNNFQLKRKLFTSVKNMTLVPVSSWLNGLLQESFLKIYPSQVIHNGIDLNTFKPINAKSVKDKYNLFDKFVLLGVANDWTRKKGLDDFIKLNSLLIANEVIVLVGLTKKQTKLLPKNIVGIRHTESVKELASLYSCADIFINLTYQDSFSTTNLEALASGTPVITYKTGGALKLLMIPLEL